jgi:hypothetical protein
VALVRRGQELGVIRRDLPVELITAWLDALDRAADDWLLAHWQELTVDDITRVSDATVEAMRRTAAPLSPPVG